jgi:hypothetical protein
MQTKQIEGRSANDMPSYFLIRKLNYLPKLIASEGQASAHEPHSVQTSGLIEYFSPSEIAPTGHSSIHVPQAIQSSLIT